MAESLTIYQKNDQLFYFLKIKNNTLDKTPICKTLDTIPNSPIDAKSVLVIPYSMISIMVPTNTIERNILLSGLNKNSKPIPTCDKPTIKKNVPSRYSDSENSSIPSMK